MATKVQVNGKFIQRPGVYATIKSGIRNPAISTTYGNILIIDDGIGSGFGGGSGVSGAYKSGTDAIYEFSTIQDFQAFIKGGELWNLAKALFNPAPNQAGISKLFYIKAATTTQATISITLTNGSLTIKTKDEGTGANGVLASSELSRGIAAKFVASGSNFKFQLWHGTYKGTDSANGISWDTVPVGKAKPVLLAESPEFLAISDLVTWLNSSPDFLNGFVLSASTATGNFVTGDLTTYPSYILASGATDTYNASDVDAAIGIVNNLDFTHILATKYGADATSLNNTKLFDFIQNQSKYDRLLVVAGGADKNTFLSGSDSSATTSAYYDSDKVIVIHGSVKKAVRATTSGFATYNQLYHAALQLGRNAGLPPYVPLTIKSIDIDGITHSLSDDEQELAISKGIGYSYYDYELGGVFVTGLDVTSLQSNDYLINDDGTTYSWQIKRIEADLNKGIVFAGKKRFFNPTGQGGNRTTTSEVEVKTWAETYLASKTASAQSDNLIISASNISASINQDNLYLNYDFVPNSEIKAIVVTGTVIEG